MPDTKPTVYMFAGHNTSRHGGGILAAQLARAYVREGYRVAYFSYDSPQTPMVSGNITEVNIDRCNVNCIKTEATAEDILYSLIPCPVSHSIMGDFVGRTVYYAIDNWEVWYNHKKGRTGWCWYVPGLEDRFVAEADMSYGISPPLKDYLGADSVLCNAYDPTIFKWEEHKPPVKKAVLWGYSGGFADTKLISEVARLTPGVEYVLIGERRGSEPVVSGVPNVKEVGSRLLEQLPAIAVESDVGLVLRHGPVAEYMCPTKSWEYLGSGLRFVSAGYDYPNSDYNPACVISPSANPHDIADTITNVYKLLPELTEAQALEHTWEKRIAQVHADLGI